MYCSENNKGSFFYSTKINLFIQYSLAKYSLLFTITKKTAGMTNRLFIFSNILIVQYVLHI